MLVVESLRIPRFTDGKQFDITPANTRDHVGYGARRAYFGLGADLTRRRLTVMFHELSARCPTSTRGQSGLAYDHRSSRASSAWLPGQAGPCFADVDA